jgi:hypothetical protein
MNPAYAPSQVHAVGQSHVQVDANVAAQIMMGAVPPPMNNPFVAAMPQSTISFASFAVPEVRAKEIFNEWREGRWFAPAEFGKLRQGELYGFMVPYYVFIANITAKYGGRVGFHEVQVSNTVSHPFHSFRHGNHHHTIVSHSGSAATTTSTAIRWHPAQGTMTTQYSDVMICASVVNADRKLIKEIEPFALEKVVSTPSYQSQLGPSIDWQSAWNDVLPKIKQEQKEKATLALKRENGADEVERVSVDLMINNLAYKLVYFPVYYYGYSFEGVEYKFFINGQTGSRKGERPYGFGAVGRLANKIGSGIVGLFSTEPLPQADPKDIEEWKQMQANGKQ